MVKHEPVLKRLCQEYTSCDTEPVRQLYARAMLFLLRCPFESQPHAMEYSRDEVVFHFAHSGEYQVHVAIVELAGR